MTELAIATELLSELNVEPPKVFKKPDSYIFNGLNFEPYDNENQLKEIMEMMEKDLSEPYSIYTYRYFINHCPNLCWLARDPETNQAIGSIVCKLDERKGTLRGYIAMLAVAKTHRKRGIGMQ